MYGSYKRHVELRKKKKKAEQWAYVVEQIKYASQIEIDSGTTFKCLYEQTVDDVGFICIHEWFQFEHITSTHTHP